MLELNLMPHERLDVDALVREHALTPAWAEYHLHRATDLVGGWWRGPLHIRRAEWTTYLARFARGLPRPEVELPPEPAARNRGQRVYFAEAGVPLRVKIGVTKNIAQRLRGLQAGTPDRVAFQLTIAGDRATERWLHERFAHLRLHSEWFRFDDELAVYIDALAAAPGVFPWVPSRDGGLR